MGRRFASAGAVLRYRRRLVVIAAAAVVGVLWLAPSGPAASDNAGAVYVETNTAPVNYVIAFDRAHDGTLSNPVRYATGGAGNPAGNPPLGIPHTDSSGAIALSDNGQFLFAVNAGNNTVSSFRVGPHGLELADVEASLGTRPVSVTSHDHLVYVLNSAPSAASISGYSVDANGGLTPIAGSQQPAAGLPAQVQFDQSGNFVVVSERLAGAHGVLATYAIGHDGAAAPPVGHPSSDDTPYAIAFTNDDTMIVANEHFPAVFPPAPLSSVSSYGLSKKDGTVTAGDTELAHAGGACWAVITNDGKFVFVTSPFTQNVNSFGIDKKTGNLSPVNGTSVVATTAGLALDDSLSRDSKYLYVLDSAGFASDSIDEYTVNKDGTINADRNVLLVRRLGHRLGRVVERQAVTVEARRCGPPPTTSERPTARRSALSSRSALRSCSAGPRRAASGWLWTRSSRGSTPRSRGSLTAASSSAISRHATEPGSTASASTTSTRSPPAIASRSARRRSSSCAKPHRAASMTTS